MAPFGAFGLPFGLRELQTQAKVRGEALGGHLVASLAAAERVAMPSVPGPALYCQIVRGRFLLWF